MAGAGSAEHRPRPNSRFDGRVIGRSPAAAGQRAHPRQARPESWTLSLGPPTGLTDNTRQHACHLASPVASPGRQREDTSVEDTSSVVVNLLLVHSLNAIRTTGTQDRRTAEQGLAFSSSAARSGRSIGGGWVACPSWTCGTSIRGEDRHLTPKTSALSHYDVRSGRDVGGSGTCRVRRTGSQYVSPREVRTAARR
jgi:hypothetical protein